jgi:hypothetical protein
VAIGEVSFFSSSVFAGTMELEFELSKRRAAGSTARPCDALRSRRAAEVVVRNEDMADGPSLVGLVGGP